MDGWMRGEEKGQALGPWVDLTNHSVSRTRSNYTRFCLFAL